MCGSASVPQRRFSEPLVEGVGAQRDLVVEIPSDVLHELRLPTGTHNHGALFAKALQKYAARYVSCASPHCDIPQNGYPEDDRGAEGYGRGNRRKQRGKLRREVEPARCGGIHPVWMVPKNVPTLLTITFSPRSVSHDSTFAVPSASGILHDPRRPQLKTRPCSKSCGSWSPYTCWRVGHANYSKRRGTPSQAGCCDEHGGDDGNQKEVRGVDDMQHKQHLEEA